jgi:hypothetical protein
VKVTTAYTLQVLGDGVLGPATASPGFLFAGVSSAPSSSPTRGSSSGAAVVHVNILAVAGTNGAAITSYEVQIDDGLGGAFTELQGGQAASLSLSAQKTTGVVQGRYYRVQYRAHNAIGAGPFSSTTYVLAADPPETLVVSGTSSQLSASIVGTELVIIWGLPQNGGSEILQGRVEIR